MILTRPGVLAQQEMLDKAAIKELLEFERFCRDNALWGEMHKCFSDDAKVSISWYQGSGHGFVEASSKMAGRAPHKIHNTEIWLTGEKAVAIMMATIEMRREIDGVAVVLSSDAKLVFRVQKADGLWMIAAFDSIYEWDSIVPVFPNNQISIPPIELKGFRESYAVMSYMSSKDGRKINQELPGIDRPDLVEALYREADEWLCQK